MKIHTVYYKFGTILKDGRIIRGSEYLEAIRYMTYTCIYRYNVYIFNINFNVVLRNTSTYWKCCTITCKYCSNDCIFESRKSLFLVPKDFFGGR